MAENTSWFGPSERALEFGAQYAKVLAEWGALFSAASALVESNVALGRLAVDSSSEFESWVRETAAGPWNWMSPDSLAKFMAQFSANMPPRG